MMLSNSLDTLEQTESEPAMKDSPETTNTHTDTHPQREREREREREGGGGGGGGVDPLTSRPSRTPRTSQ